MRRWSAIHTAVFRLTRGRVGRRLVDNDMLLLTTKGRFSGRPHTVPLLYLAVDESLIVVASYGGRPQHPDWYENLVADERVSVQVRGERRQMTARTAGESERSHWWPRIVAAYSGYAAYASRTERVIPVVFLDPTSD